MLEEGLEGDPIDFENYSLPDRKLRLRNGADLELEEIADKMLKDSLANVTRHSAKSDIMTAYKLIDRYRREVYTQSGVCDPATRRGMYHRAKNASRPELNSRDGYAPPRSHIVSNQIFSNEYGSQTDD